MPVRTRNLGGWYYYEGEAGLKIRKRLENGKMVYQYYWPVEGIWGTTPLPPRGDDPIGGGGGTSRPPRPRPVVQPRIDTFERQKTPLRVVYGKKRVKGAARIYDKVQSSNGRSLVVYEVCWGPIQSMTEIKIDGRTLTQLGLTAADYEIYLGTSSSAADSIMATYESRWATISHATDVALVIILFKKPTASLSMPDVTQFEALIEGMKVFDPAQDATLVTRYYRSDNPRLAIADFETDVRYGGGYSKTKVYSAPGFLNAVNDCDENLGGGRKRYTIGLELDQEGNFEDIIEEMRGHAALCYAYNNGYRQWWVDKLRDNCGVTFSNGTGTKNIVAANPLEYKDPTQIPTRVIVWFTNKNAEYKEDFVVDEHPDLASGGVELVEWTYRYMGILDNDQAKRIARLTRKRHSIEKFGQIRVKAEGMRVLPGSRVTIGNLTEWNWAAQEATILDVAPVVGRSSWDLTIEPWADLYDDADATVSSYTPPANASPYEVPPNIVDLTVTLPSDAGDPGTAYWAIPQVRSEDLFGTAYWTQSGLTNYDGTKVNDGVTNVECFRRLSSPATLTFDAGVGLTKSFREVVITSNSDTSPGGVEYSDDGAAWTGVTATSSHVISGVRTIQWTSAAGAHRYWRFGDIASSPIFYEVQFNEYEGEYLFGRGFNIYDNSVSPKALVRFIPGNEAPTSTKPVEIPVTSFSTDIIVTTLSASEPPMESAGIRHGSFVSGAGGNEGALTLANGTNNDVAIKTSVWSDFGAVQIHQYVSGPTAVFTITGLVATSYSGGDYYTLYNPTAYAMTIAHQSASSTDVNRIITPTAADVVIPAGGWARFLRLASASRWLLEYFDGGSMLSLKGITGATTGGIFADTTATIPPIGMPFTSTSTTSESLVTLLSVTGKGIVDFLAFGSSIVTAGNRNINLKITVDGVVLTGFNDDTFAVVGATSPAGTGLGRAIVGSITPVKDGATNWLAPHPDAQGIPFKTSLLIEYRRTTAATGSRFAAYHWKEMN